MHKILIQLKWVELSWIDNLPGSDLLSRTVLYLAMFWALTTAGGASLSFLLSLDGSVVGLKLKKIEDKTFLSVKF